MNVFIRRALAPVSAVILLSACTPVIVDGYPNIPGNYYEGDFALATPKGAITTVVVGDPFATRSDAFADRVRGLMKNRVGNWPISFVAGQGPNTTPPYKVIVVFNPGDNASYKSICQTENQIPTTANEGGQVSVLMAFCEGSNFKSGIHGHVYGVTGQNDPKFVSLVQQVATDMVPSDGMLRYLRMDNSN